MVVCTPWPTQCTSLCGIWPGSLSLGISHAFVIDFMVELSYQEQILRELRS